MQEKQIKHAINDYNQLEISAEHTTTTTTKIR